MNVSQDEVVPAILLVEDDRKLARLIREYLEFNGYRVEIERRGDKAAHRIAELGPDLVILDLMLPGEDGLSVCRRARNDYCGPILILTAREEDMDQIAGLELGADDYVKKPVHPRVLLARIRALLRRGCALSERGCRKITDLKSDLIFGSLCIDPGSRAVFLDGRSIVLTSNEFDLLRMLAEHAGKVLDRGRLFSALRGIDYDGFDRSIDIIVSRLRKKLFDNSANPRRIKTVWGRGYLFAIDAWDRP